MCNSEFPKEGNGPVRVINRQPLKIPNKYKVFKLANYDTSKETHESRLANLLSSTSIMQACVKACRMYSTYIPIATHSLGSDLSC